MKKLMVRVLPGDEDVLARLCLQVKVLIREDFPTLDLPANATSGSEFAGKELVGPITVSKTAVLIFISGSDIFLDADIDIRVIKL